MVTLATIAQEFAAIVGFWCSRTSSVLVGDGPIGGMSATLAPSRLRAPVHFYAESVGQSGRKPLHGSRYPLIRRCQRHPDVL